MLKVTNTSQEVKKVSDGTRWVKLKPGESMTVDTAVGFSGNPDFKIEKTRGER